VPRVFSEWFYFKENQYVRRLQEVMAGDKKGLFVLYPETQIE
jgi:hypothetical protein